MSLSWIKEILTWKLFTRKPVKARGFSVSVSTNFLGSSLAVSAIHEHVTSIHLTTVRQTVLVIEEKLSYGKTELNRINQKFYVKPTAVSVLSDKL